MKCLKMGKKRRRRICVVLRIAANLSKSRFSMMELKSLARFLIRNLYIKKLNLSLSGTSLASKSMTFIRVDIRYPMATLIARNCNLSNLVKIVLVLLNRKIWQPYSIDSLNIERYKLSRRCGCELYQIPESEVRMSKQNLYV